MATRMVVLAALLALASACSSESPKEACDGRLIEIRQTDNEARATMDQHMEDDPLMQEVPPSAQADENYAAYVQEARDMLKPAVDEYLDAGCSPVDLDEGRFAYA